MLALQEATQVSNSFHQIILLMQQFHTKLRQNSKVSTAQLVNTDMSNPPNALEYIIQQKELSRNACFSRREGLQKVFLNIIAYSTPSCKGNQCLAVRKSTFLYAFIETHVHLSICCYMKHKACQCQLCLSLPF